MAGAGWILREVAAGTRPDRPAVPVIGGDLFVENGYDVVVAGGGTAGPFAAIAAARQGARTLLLEPTNFLGGIGTGGAIQSYYHGISGALQREIDRAVDEISAKIGGKPASGFDPEAKKYVLQKACLEAGVEVRYLAAAVGALMDGDAVRGVAVADAAGRYAVTCKVAIDCTGDGDLAAACGAEFEIGRDGDGFPQPYSLTPGVLRSGAISHLNFDAGWADPTDPDDLTRAHLEGRSRLHRDGPLPPEERNLYLAGILGVRESRRIVGDYMLTLEDLLNGRRRSDIVMRTRAHYDNHAPDYENESLDARILVVALYGWPVMLECDVPYGCLLPKGVDGLLVACRAVSATHDAAQCFRMQRDMQQLGEVAGRAAALAAARGISPRWLPVEWLQDVLVASGGLAATVRAAGRVGGDRPPAKDPKELVSDLAGPGRREAMVELYRLGACTRDAVRAAMDHPNASVSRDAAILLALQRDASVLDRILAILRDKIDDAPKTGSRAFPRWYGAIVCLEVLRDKRAVPALVETLDTPGINVHAAGLIIKALAAIGDRSALPAVRRAFDRTDFADMRSPMQVSSGGRWKPSVVADWTWSIRIGAVAAAADLGDISLLDRIRSYASSDHACIRRYAEKHLARLNLARRIS